MNLLCQYHDFFESYLNPDAFRDAVCSPRGTHKKLSAKDELRRRYRNGATQAANFDFPFQHCNTELPIFLHKNIPPVVQKKTDISY